MEYCDGGDLNHVIKGARRRLFPESKASSSLHTHHSLTCCTLRWHPPPSFITCSHRQLLPQVLNWFVQMALGLHYMHTCRVLHRDLKTQNIFLLGNGRLVLGDLGISKVLDGTMDFASTCIGTPYYMSPEIFKNKPYNHKSDVWALGCVLYEMTTLNHAFDASSLNGLASKIIKGRYPPVHSKYSKHLRDLIAQMLSTSPSARPDLEQLLQVNFIRKHIQNFLADIVSRENGHIGEGTMVIKTAAVNMIGGGGHMPSGMSLEAHSSGKDAMALKKQMEGLGLHDVVSKALEPPEAQRPNSANAVAVAKEQASALRREEDRKKAVESALQRLREERQERLKQRQKMIEQARVGVAGNGERRLSSRVPSSRAQVPRSRHAVPSQRASLDSLRDRVRENQPVGAGPGLGGVIGQKAGQPYPQVPRQRSRRREQSEESRKGQGQSRSSNSSNSSRRELREDRQRVKDLDKFSQAREAERIAEEAARRKREALEDQRRREVAKEKERLRQREEQDKLRQDKLDLDQKMLQRERLREERRQKERAALADVNAGVASADAGGGVRAAARDSLQMHKRKPSAVSARKEQGSNSNGHGVGHVTRCESMDALPHHKVKGAGVGPLPLVRVGKGEQQQQQQPLSARERMLVRKREMQAQEDAAQLELWRAAQAENKAARERARSKEEQQYKSVLDAQRVRSRRPSGSAEDKSAGGHVHPSGIESEPNSARRSDPGPAQLDEGDLLSHLDAAIANKGGYGRRDEAQPAPEQPEQEEHLSLLSSDSEGWAEEDLDKNEADEDIHKREEELEMELHRASLRCDELRQTLQEAKIIIARSISPEKAQSKEGARRSGRGVKSEAKRDGVRERVREEERTIAAGGGDNKLQDYDEVEDEDDSDASEYGSDVFESSYGEAEVKQFYEDSRSLVNAAKAIDPGHPELPSQHSSAPPAAPPKPSMAAYGKEIGQAKSYDTVADPVESPAGRLGDRIKHLRERCIEGLGEGTFTRAYKYLKDIGDAEDEDTFHGDHTQEKLLVDLTEILGHGKVHYYNLIDQLLFIEATHFGA
ncbi:unnamed protein product [Chrysoparadoxa australica]